jgi:hypothetical protein
MAVGRSVASGVTHLARASLHQGRISREDIKISIPDIFEILVNTDFRGVITVDGHHLEDNEKTFEV